MKNLNEKIKKLVIAVVVTIAFVLVAYVDFRFALEQTGLLNPQVETVGGPPRVPYPWNYGQV